ncbi:MAG: CHRD domain-containing protein [Sphingomicrobium sp.]
MALISTTVIAAAAAFAAPAAEGGRKFTVQLTGAAEAPVTGDPDGSGTARLTVNPGQGRVCYDIEARNIDAPTAGHIHEAPPGVAGPVVVGLFASSTNTSLSLSGCVPLSRAQAMEIIKTPSDYYVNLHNAAYPGGAIRGQMSK